VRAVLVRGHVRERGQHRGAEVPVDPDHVQGGCQVHDAMVTGGQVIPHHQDPVTGGLARAASRQQAQPDAPLPAARSSRHQATARTVNGARITKIR